MRSKSSVLSHILNSNPQIAGYGETQICYLSNVELEELIGRIGIFFRTPRLTEKYAMDKLVHKQVPVDSPIIQDPRIHWLVLLREPERTIPSIVQMGSQRWPNDIAACDYYVERLGEMAALASRINDKQRCLLLQSEQLMVNTDVVFRHLEKWLGLTHSLREKYKRHRATGVWGVGDGSALIHEGKLIKEERPHEVTVSPEVMAKARGAYDQTLRSLREYCGCIDV